MPDKEQARPGGAAALARGDEVVAVLGLWDEARGKAPTLETLSQVGTNAVDALRRVGAGIDVDNRSQVGEIGLHDLLSLFKLARFTLHTPTHTLYRSFSL